VILARKATISDRHFLFFIIQANTCHVTIFLLHRYIVANLW